jgi:hypothetical protein
MFLSIFFFAIYAFFAAIHSQPCPQFQVSSFSSSAIPSFQYSNIPYIRHRPRARPANATLDEYSPVKPSVEHAE